MRTLEKGDLLSHYTITPYCTSSFINLIDKKKMISIILNSKHQFHIKIFFFLYKKNKQMWGKYFKCGISIKKKKIHKVTTYLLFAREKQRQVGAWKFWDLSVFFNQIARKGWLWSTSWEHQEPREPRAVSWLGNALAWK